MIVIAGTLVRRLVKAKNSAGICENNRGAQSVSYLLEDDEMK